MKEITFKKISDRFICISELCGVGSCEIKLLPATEGRLIIGGEVIPLTAGAARIDPKRLKPGSYEARLISKGHSAHIANLEITEDCVLRLQNTDSDILALAEHAKETAARLSKIENELLKIRELIERPLHF